MSLLYARLFGFPVIELDHHPIKFSRRKTLALFVYLLLESHSSPGRESLMATFWGDFAEKEAGAALRHAFWEINHTLGEGWIERHGEAVCIPAAQCQIDVHRFDSLTRNGNQAEDLLEASALYRGDFLAGFTLRDCPDFDNWQQIQSTIWRDRFSNLLQTLSKVFSDRKEFHTAIAYARRWLSLDLLNEAAHRKLMVLYDAAGKRSTALRQYEECCRILKNELDIEPESATQQLYASLCVSSKPQLSALTVQKAPQPGEKAVQPDLPLPTTPFVGREAEIDKIKKILASADCRLLTLTGTGGIGKTRLALEIIRNSTITKGFKDGVHFIPLAQIDTADNMVKIIADEVQDPMINSPIYQNFEDGRRRLLNFLSSRHCLLVLDNLEHLIEPVASFIVDLLARSTKIKLLCTSRQRLNLMEEWSMEIVGLPVPEKHEVDRMQNYSSIQLFLKHATRISNTFEPSKRDWEAMIRICEIVGGSPLGIEMASAWVRTFSCSEIALEMERDLDFLRANWQGVPERMQSLRAAFEYSWRLLPESERSLFRKLAVFHGSFRYPSAAQITGATTALMASLIDRSLLKRNSGDWYQLHEVLHQYAREKLINEPNEFSQVQNFHSHYYLDLLMDTVEDLKGSGQLDALATLNKEYENIQAAWKWALENQRYSEILQAALAYLLYHEMGSHYMQGKAVFNDAYERVKRAQPVKFDTLTLLKLQALFSAARKRFSFASGVSNEFIKYHHESLRLLKEIPDCAEKAYALLLLNAGPGDVPYLEVAEQCRQCIRIFEEMGDVWGQAISWLILGDASAFVEGKDETALAAYHNSIKAFDLLNNYWGHALCCNGLGNLAQSQGNFDTAIARYTESLSIYQQKGYIWREAETRSSLAASFEKVGKLSEAAQAYQLNVECFHKLGEHAIAEWNLNQAKRILAELG